jgi:hypothetical protein
MFPGDVRMRDQYVGDISDFIKFSFLRALAGADKVLGIAWYYVRGNDGRPDGRHVEWKNETAWQTVDASLFRGLSNLKNRSVAALEQASFWPQGSIFHTVPVPTRSVRAEWAEQKRAILKDADIVFLDPDNGIGAETEKHATLSELKLLRRSRRTIVFISFPGRSAPHEMLLKQLHEKLARDVGAKQLRTLRTNVSVPRTEGSRSYVQRQRWLTLIDPDEQSIVRAHVFAGKLNSVPRVTAKFD